MSWITCNELGVSRQALDSNPFPAGADECPKIGPRPDDRRMIVVCAWCSKQLARREGHGTSHGICPECAASLLAESELPG